MAGLLAARVLADAFETVTVFDRDPLPDEPNIRRGIPQARHLHVLHEAGRKTIEDLFPGFSSDLIGAGAEQLDFSSDVQMYDMGDFVAEGPDRIPMYCGSRPLFEQVTRRRVADIDEVRIRERCQVTAYLTDDVGSNVEGVAIRNENASSEELSADVVVDATGRTSHTPTWLTEHGYSTPPVDEVEIDLGYSSILLDRPAEDKRAFIVFPTPPETRGAGVLPIEGDRWLMTIAGLHGDHPPTEYDALADFAASLSLPVCKRLIDTHEVVSEDIAHYPFPSSRRHRYWELDRFPDGLVVVGDAIASFNPVYGQGMSVAALEAVHLHHTLAEGDFVDLGQRFFERIEKVVEDAWDLAVGSDFRYSETSGPKPLGTDLLNPYFARLSRKAHTDSILADAYYRVIVMERRPISLLRPRIVWRVMKPTL